VRVHLGSAADTSTRAVGALAYTVGRDVVFRDGAFAPQAAEGKELLAHELAHVAQQAAGSVLPGTAVTPADDPSEREADRIAKAVVHGDQEPKPPRRALRAPTA
jgi:hypothetical protein